MLEIVEFCKQKLKALKLNCTVKEPGTRGGGALAPHGTGCLPSKAQGVGEKRG